MRAACMQRLHAAVAMGKTTSLTIRSLHAKCHSMAGLLQSLGGMVEEVYDTSRVCLTASIAEQSETAAEASQPGSSWAEPYSACWGSCLLHR